MIPLVKHGGAIYCFSNSVIIIGEGRLKQPWCRRVGERSVKISQLVAGGTLDERAYQECITLSVLVISSSTSFVN